MHTTQVSQPIFYRTHINGRTLHRRYTAHISRQTRDARALLARPAPRALGDCSKTGGGRAPARAVELRHAPACYSTRQRRRLYWLNSFSIASFTSPLHEASAALHCSSSKPISINCLTDSSLPLGSPWLEEGLEEGFGFGFGFGRARAGAGARVIGRARQRKYPSSTWRWPRTRPCYSCTAWRPPRPAGHLRLEGGSG